MVVWLLRTRFVASPSVELTERYGARKTCQIFEVAARRPIRSPWRYPGAPKQHRSESIALLERGKGRHHRLCDRLLNEAVLRRRDSAFQRGGGVCGSIARFEIRLSETKPEIWLPEQDSNLRPID